MFASFAWRDLQLRHIVEAIHNAACGAAKVAKRKVEFRHEQVEELPEQVLDQRLAAAVRLLLRQRSLALHKDLVGAPEAEIFRSTAFGLPSWHHAKQPATCGGDSDTRGSEGGKAHHQGGGRAAVCTCWPDSCLRPRCPYSSPLRRPL